MIVGAPADNHALGLPAMPRPSKLSLLPATLSVAACLAVGAGVGQGEFPEVWPYCVIHDLPRPTASDLWSKKLPPFDPKLGQGGFPEAWPNSFRPFPNDPRSNTVETKSDKLPPLDSSLAPGNLFDKEKCSLLLSKDHLSHCNKVPAWLVGTWNSKDEQSGDEGSSAHLEYWRTCREIGGFADKTGQVWSLDLAGEWAQSTDGSQLDCYFVYTQSSPSPDEHHSEVERISFQLDGLSHLISSCSRGSIEDTYYLISPGVVRLKEVIRSYDWQGHPLNTHEKEWNLCRLGEVAPDLTRTTSDGKPLYPMFIQFLKDHGMADRIPDAPPAPGVVAKP